MALKSKKTPTSPCPCGGKSYQSCCEVFHLGQPAPNAEALMRSRYSAYVLMLEDYLLATWHPTTRPSTLDLRSEPIKWLGLKIKPNFQADAHRVEFIARYKLGGRAYRLHEISRFIDDGGLWFYVDGHIEEN